MKSVLIANRGEIAIRIAQSLHEMGLESVAIFSEDDARALHPRRADRAVALTGRGVAPYLNAEAVIGAAHEAGCDAIHPGYGFLSESAEFARAVQAAGLTFIGPSPEALALLGDKLRARALAEEHGVPVLEGLSHAADADAALAFMRGLDGAPIVLKAVAGGGGRGMRIIRAAADLPALFEEATAEAARAFGNGALYAERLVEQARHIEVQALGDGESALHLWERDCSLQRRHQKVIEIAPAAGLDADLRAAMLGHAETLARAAGLRSLCTFEFLLGAQGRAFFIEANPRLQVEHTITEEVTGLDLVALQIGLAQGRSLSDLGLTQETRPAPKGAAIQFRVALERADGFPATGALAAYQPPGGPGVRVDGAGFAGMEAGAAFDSLIAKLIVQADDLPAALARGRRALAGFRIAGVDSNLPLLRALAQLPELAEGRATTRLIETRAADLAEAAAALADPEEDDAPAPRPAAPAADVPPHAVCAPTQGLLLRFVAEEGALVAKGAKLAVLEAMKMQHSVLAPHPGRVAQLLAPVGDVAAEGAPLLILEPDAAAGETDAQAARDPDHISPALAELRQRRAVLEDAARPEAVAKRHAKGKRMPRENLAELFDDGFEEYGAHVVAAQRDRFSEDELIRATPADGLVCGVGDVNGADYPGAARTAALHYDYTVFAGTQGAMNHLKSDRMIEVIARQRIPAVFFCEGGGGRPGDVDEQMVSGLDCATFVNWARLSGQVPLVGIGSGRIFAGNAALLGCCDVIIATRDATMGMGGPAMIEGGGLGRFRPEEVGPVSVQAPNGVIDLLVEDEAAAVQAARRYLSYFQGRSPSRAAPDVRLARSVVPDDRLEVYDSHAAIDAIVDLDSFLELRAGFAPGLVTGLARIDGWPVGVLASNPLHLAGAITDQGADKAARFMQLCDAHGLPILSLVDTPGMMVGPDIEKRALVRHCSRLFVTGASLSVPVYAIVLRKAYGLGAMALVGGSMKIPELTAAWPSGEFGAMGLEGAVRLGWRKQLEEAGSPEEQKKLFDELVARAYRRGRALNIAAHHEIDAVIDPAETRDRLCGALARHAERRRAEPRGATRPCVDTW